MGNHRNNKRAANNPTDGTANVGAFTDDWVGSKTAPDSSTAQNRLCRNAGIPEGEGPCWTNRNIPPQDWYDWVHALRDTYPDAGVGFTAAEVGFARAGGMLTLPAWNNRQRGDVQKAIATGRALCPWMDKNGIADASA